MDSRLVQVFKTDDPAILPLATMALEAEGIEYVVRSEGKVDSMDWVMSQTPTIRPVVMEIVVTPDVAARARDLLVDLEQQSAAAPPAATPSADVLPASEPPIVTLENATTGATVGTISEAQLQELSSHLEEDAPQQYNITGGTLDRLRHAGVDAALVDLLRRAVGADGAGLVIRWTVR